MTINECEMFIEELFKIREIMSDRVIILDTETTGLSPKTGHRIIEIGCLEMVDRKLTGEKFHTYLQPYRFVEIGAFMVHGISDAFLADKPRFNDICPDFLEFIKKDEIIAHNAQFDLGFLDNECRLSDHFVQPFTSLSDENKITCTKRLAESKFGRGGNSLNELCVRFGIDKSERALHGALIDCELLAQVYLKLTEDE